MVRKAREDEMLEFRKHQVCVNAPIEECIRKTGKKPIGSRWIDINNGDEDSPEYRSRRVAQEITRDNRQD